VLSFDDVGDGGFEDVAFAVFGDFIQEFSIFCLKCANLIEMVLLDRLQALDLVLEQLFLLYHHLCDFGPASISSISQYV
jgi:hypothetical protein